MRVIGLTGGIATGKSTTAQYFKQRGLPVIDADRVARDCVRPQSPVLKAIVEALGPILLPSGELDRPALRQIVFSDPDARRTLEGITHPAIAVAITSHLQQMRHAGAPFAVVDAALMIETGSYTQYDRLLVVSCSAQTQLTRLMQRDQTSTLHAQGMIDAQWPLHKKEALADVLVMNDGSKSELYSAIDLAWSALFIDR